MIIVECSMKITTTTEIGYQLAKERLLAAAYTIEEESLPALQFTATYRQELNRDEI